LSKSLDIGTSGLNAAILDISLLVWSRGYNFFKDLSNDLQAILFAV